MRILITGITGFAGSHLAEFCLSRGATVFGTVRWRSRMDNIEGILDRITLIECDLRDHIAVRNALEVSRPDVIFHLAAQSFVPTSWRAPAETFTTNVISQINLFEALRELKLDPLVQIAGSSEEYGLVYPSEVPITEDNPLRPLSPYAVSKVGQDLLGYQYFKSYGLRVVRTRAFNHTGPRRGEVFVTSNFAKQLVEIELGLREPVIYVGNLNAVRDFSDVRDIVRGYWLALEKGDPGEVYNLASGVGRSIGDILEMLLSITGMAGDVKVVQDPDRMRPSDVEILIGDSSKIREKTGWEPQIAFEKTLSDLVEYWRAKLSKKIEV